MSLRGETEEAINVINNELIKGETVYSIYELDNLRLLKVIVLGTESTSGRDLLFTIIKSSKDNFILESSFRLLKEYLVRTSDTEFLDALSVYFENQDLHTLRFKFYQFKVKFLISKLVDGYSKEEDRTRSLVLQQLKKDAEYILQNFPGTESLEEIYRILVYVALNQSSPQYRLAADYYIKILDFTEDISKQQLLKQKIGNCYFLNDDFEVSAEFYMSAILNKGALREDDLGRIWFRLVTARINANMFAEDLVEDLENAFIAGDIPFDMYLKIQWNIALHFRKSGKNKQAVSVINNALERFDENSVPVLLDVRFKWFSLYVKYSSGYISPSSLVESQKLINRLNELDEGQLEEEVLNLLKSQVSLLKAQFLLANNEINEAKLVIKRLQNTFPNSQAAELSFIILADFYTMTDEHDLAESYLLMLADKYPESDYAAEALLEAALNAEKRDSSKFKQSIKLLNQLVNTYVDSPLVFFALRHQGDLLRKASDFSGAVSVYDNLIQKFPNHPNRYLAELSRLDCLLALADQNTNFDFKEIIAELERLSDLPNLPTEFQLEVRFKIAFIFSKIDEASLANKVILSIINEHINTTEKTVKFTSVESYWISRSLFLLCEHLDANNEFEECKKIYRMIIANNLPGYQLAKQLLIEF